MGVVLQYTGKVTPTGVPTPAAIGAKSAAAARPRLQSIDLLRGLIMIVMALDHARDFFGATGQNPRDIAEPALFVTRWVTHFCAPVFIFLSGISAWLYGSRGRSTGELSRFLLTRGVWLVLLEFTLVRLGWRFTLDLDVFVIQVIFAIGASMVVLAALVYLPRWAIATIGLAMIAGHNLFDGVRPADLGPVWWVWNVLHQQGPLNFGPHLMVYVFYPLIPWIGVMAVGYALGPLFRREPAERVQWLVMLGFVVTVGFAILRATNLYGDPAPWAVHNGALATLLSFINCEKYPPSLLYLMMTLGPALLLLAAFERARGPLANAITTYGQVPLFFYVTHLFVLHGLAVALEWMRTGDVSWMFGLMALQKPAGYGLGLPGIYAMWLVAVVLLYPFCRWFASLKQRRTEWWWSYL